MNFDQLSVLKEVNKMALSIEHDFNNLKKFELVLDSRYNSEIDNLFFNQLRKLSKEQLVTMVYVYNDHISSLISKLNEDGED